MSVDPSLSFDPRLWTRLEHEGTPIWVRPDRPDGFVPNRAGDEVLCELAAGGGGSAGAAAAPLDLGAQRFLARLPVGAPREYAGRHAHRTTDRLQELWFHLLNGCNLTCDHCLVSSAPEIRYVFFVRHIRFGYQ